MIRVNNKKAIANLSRKSLCANRQRNLVAILAIALTATLFTALFTVGGSMLATMQNDTMRQVGTKAHGGYKFLTQEQYDAVAADPKVKDISYNIIAGEVTTPELNKTYTELRYTQAKDAEWSFCTPTTGTLPVEKYDLATTTAVLDALGVPHELGQTVHLDFTAQGKDCHQDFTLCGFWEGDIAMGANEAFVSREYCDEVAPVMTVPLCESGNSDYTGSINPSLWFATSWNIDSQMGALSERCGFDDRVNEGVNWAYASATVDVSTLALVIGILVLILLSGYLIIYNVFQISVSRDIRFYGLLKTIGTTPRQIKTIVRRQALTLCLAGIPLGLLAGFAVGRLLMPTIVRTTTIVDSFVITLNPLIFAGAAAFALLTVFISCIRPCRLAAKVSPVEAVRWTGVAASGKRTTGKTRKVTPYRMAAATLRRDRKKAAVVILSLTLSLVLLNGTYTVVRGFDMDKYVQDSTVTDFTVTDSSLRSGRSSASDLNGVSPDALAAIDALPGLESRGAVWAHNGSHVFSKQARERALSIVEKNAAELPSPYADENVRMLREDGTIFDFIYGVEEPLWDKLELAGGKALDKEKFASGDYVIVTAFWDTGKDAYYEPGDQVTIDFENGNSKTYTVLAAGDIPYSLSQQFGFNLDICFTLPADEYQRQMGDTQAMSVGFNVDDAHLDAAEEWCQNYTENVESNLTYTSKATIADQFRTDQTMFAVVGGAMSILLGLIGILNFANAVITSVHARQRELAVLQSVGMTGRQLKSELTWEGLLYAFWTVGLTVTAGSGLCWLGVKLVTAQIWCFTWHFSLLPVLICIPILLVIAAAVPRLCYHSLAQKSVVERLREAE